MSIQTELRTYSDLRKLVSPSSFTAAMGYLSWHNRLTMTAMLEPWQALVVALACDRKSIDGLLFGAVKAFLDEHQKADPQTVDDCRALAEQLIGRLFSHE